MMINRLKFLFLFSVIAVLAACVQQSARQIPLSDFFKTPEKSYFKISPDGKYISYIKAVKEHQCLYIKSLQTGKEERAMAFTDVGIRPDYFWTYGNQLVISEEVIALDQFKLFVVDVNTLKLRNLLTLDKVKMRSPIFRSRLQPDVITIAMNKRDPAIFDVYRLNVRTGDLEPYIVNPGNITEWFPDADGSIRLAKASDGVNESILYRADEKTEFKPIIVNNFKNWVQPIAFTDKKDVFYALSNVNRDKTALVEINALTGKEERVVFESDKGDIHEYGYSRNKHRMEYAGWDEDKPKIHFLNPQTARIYDDLAQQLQGNEIRLIDRDTLEDKLIISTYTDRNPGAFYLYQVASNKLTKLCDVNSSVKPEELCSMNPISYKASDGLEINGYITYPLGKLQKDLPVVVLLRNGPWGRVNWGYSPDVQFLANRGYAVFQVNYRGSTGYGKAFHSAGFKQVGGKIQQDITDGVRWLIKQGIADPKHIAIYGGGFGGFSALYGISNHPELYNCAIVQYGLINFFTYIKDAPPFFKPYLKMTYEMVGNPETDADQLRAISPVFHPDKIKLPLIIFQGARDPRANITELNQFVRELKNRKVPVTYVLKENERGYFRSEHNRMEMYAQIEKFLNTNMWGKP